MEKETPDIYILEELDLFVKKMMKKVEKHCDSKLGYDQVLEIIRDECNNMLND